MTITDYIRTLSKAVMDGVVAADAPVMTVDSLDTYIIIDAANDMVYITDVDPDEVEDDATGQDRS